MSSLLAPIGFMCGRSAWRPVVTGLLALATALGVVMVAASPSDAWVRCTKEDAADPDEWGPTSQIPWHYPWSDVVQPDGHKSTRNVPTCRRMQGGATLTSNGVVDQSRENNGLSQNARAPLGNASGLTLEGNPRSPTYRGLQLNANGNVSWPVIDSYGDIMGYLTRPWTDSTKTRLADYWYWESYVNGQRSFWDSTQGTSNPLPAMDVQGRACMTSDSLESQYVIFSFASTGSAGGKQMRMRAFVERRALPSVMADGKTYNWDLRYTGCGGSSLPTIRSFSIAPVTYTGTYCSIDGCVVPYNNYGTLRDRWMPIAQSTSSVTNGGIFRAVVKTDAVNPDTIHAVDCFGYTDPNAYGNPSTTQTVQWYYGRVYHNGVATRMWGFLPRPRTGVKTVNCPTGT